MDPETFSLEVITEPALLSAFTDWFTERRGKVTGTIHKMLRSLRVIRRYWLKDEAGAKEISHILACLPPAERIYDNQRRWLSLAQLESIGLSRHPLNARRLIETPTTGRYLKALRTGKVSSHVGGTLRNVALWVEQSLIIRLMIRVPLRQRNVREMRLQHNLLHRPDGTWILTYRGAELKISHRNGRENHVTYTFPPELQELLADWLERWRPLVVNATGAPFVFVTRNGTPVDAKLLRQWLMTTTWAFGGVAVNPHMLRHIWATEYIKSTRDVAGAAFMLGDTVYSVLKHYAHLLDADAEARAMQWLQTRLAQGPESTPPSNPDTPPRGKGK